MIAYYYWSFGASLFCFLWYLWKWDKRYDIHFTYVMMLIPISELGALQRGISHTLESALLGNAISYIGGCFLQLAMTGCILYLCRIKFPRGIMVGLTALGMLLYSMVIFDPWLHFFYKSTELGQWMGITIIHKEYGFGHTLFYVSILAYCVANFLIFVYGLRKKRSASVKNIILLFVAELITIFVYFFQKLFPEALQLTAVSYVLSQMLIVIIMSRISLYNVDGIVMEAQMKDGDFGCFTFSLKKNFLGCNEVAEEWFPQLKALRVDFGYSNQTDQFFDSIDKWIAELESTGNRKEYDYSKGNKSFVITVGYFFLENQKRGYTFSVRDNTKDMELMRLMDDYNTKLEEEVAEKTQHIREMQQRLVLGMADMVESRDGSTGGHIKRTSKLVSILIDCMREQKQIAMEERFCKAVVKAAPMHDLGKIAVDDAILRKQGRFTAEEYAMMKTHAEKGAGIVHRLLKDMGDDYFAGIAENVAHFHHERIDGTGYPMGLRGKEIPLEARIMAIADVYDALVSKRCYKERMSFEEADRIIMEGMGNQFDADLKSAYLEAKDRFEAFYLEEFALEES